MTSYRSATIYFVAIYVELSPIQVHTHTHMLNKYKQINVLHYIYMYSLLFCSKASIKATWCIKHIFFIVTMIRGNPFSIELNLPLSGYPHSWKLSQSVSKCTTNFCKVIQFLIIALILLLLWLRLNEQNALLIVMKCSSYLNVRNSCRCHQKA